MWHRPDEKSVSTGGLSTQPYRQSKHTYHLIGGPPSSISKQHLIRMTRLNLILNTLRPDTIPMPITRQPSLRTSSFEVARRRFTILSSVCLPCVPRAWVPGSFERQRVKDVLIVKRRSDIIQQHCYWYRFPSSRSGSSFVLGGIVAFLCIIGLTRGR